MPADTMETNIFLNKEYHWLLQSFRHHLPALVASKANEAYTYSDNFTLQVIKVNKIKCNTKGNV